MATWRCVVVVASFATLAVAVGGPSAAAAPRAVWCLGERATIVADRGTTFGTSGDDVIVGTRFADEIFAGAGDDLVCSGDGPDEVHGERGDDVVRAGTGRDTLRGGGGDDDLGGGDARDDCRGGGGANVLASCNEVAPSRPAPTPEPQPTTCHPSYPTVCIPPAPPDLDCGDVPYDDFRVVGTDPHGFDGDRDGVGCET